MKLNIVLILIAVFGFSGCATKPEPASINKVIESPDSFNGKTITVEGFAYLDIETKLICSAPEELNQCLWLQIPESHKEIESKFKIETGSKIIVSGVFKVKSTKPKKNTKTNGVIYIQIGPYWHLLQKVKLTKANG